MQFTRGFDISLAKFGMLKLKNDSKLRNDMYVLKMASKIMEYTILIRKAIRRQLGSCLLEYHDVSQDSSCSILILCVHVPM